MTEGTRIIRREETKLLPWKNGGGITEELAIDPPGADFSHGDFRWRISRAGVNVAGPFSAFPGYQRIIVVTEGPGLRLHHASNREARWIAPWVPYEFSGDEPTYGDPTGGPIRDFNVFWRRDAVSVTFELCDGTREFELAHSKASTAFLHLFQGELRCALPGSEAVLRPGDCAWICSSDLSVLRVLASGISPRFVWLQVT